jgi:hypothetical protein
MFQHPFITKQTFSLEHENLTHLLNDLYITVINTYTGNSLPKKASKLIAKMQKTKYIDDLLTLALKLYTSQVIDLQVYKHLVTTIADAYSSKD